MSHILLHGEFPQVKRMLGEDLLEAPEVKVPEWQSMDVADKPMGVTHELRNVIIECAIPEYFEYGSAAVWGFNMPWAEEHFQERVSGIPHNPPPSAANWPFGNGYEDITKMGKFSHTYPERMWPKKAGDFVTPVHGLRYALGDLQDVVDQLRKSPLTRQAYLPIWFPEDTGAVHGERVPCTLGYHFLIREGRLNVTYFIRSCDFLRHLPDDVYMAMRLGQWMRDELHKKNQGIRCPISDDGMLPMPEPDYTMGSLTMHMISLHVFGGDMPNMRRQYAS